MQFPGVNVIKLFFFVTDSGVKVLQLEIFSRLAYCVLLTP